MGFSEKIISFLKQKTPGATAEFAASFFEKFPDIPKEQILIVLFFSAKTFGDVTLRSEELYTLRLIISKSTPGAKPDAVLDSALKSISSLPDAVQAAAALRDTPYEAHVTLARQILEYYKPTTPLPEKLRDVFTELCRAMGLSDKFIEDTLAYDTDYRIKREKVLNSGTGLAIAIVVILVFILAAIYLKPVFFGFLLAYLCLPMERFFERHIFSSKIMTAISACFAWLLKPLNLLRKKISRRYAYTSSIEPQEEIQRKKHEILVLKSSVATIVTIICTVCLVLVLLSYILIPKAMDLGRNIQDWAKNNEYIKKTETALERIIKTKQPGDTAAQPENAEEDVSKNADASTANETETALTNTQTVAEDKTAGNEETASAAVASADSKSKVFEISADVWPKAYEWIKENGRGMISENLGGIISMIFTNSKGLVSGIFSTAGSIITFALNVFLGIFFFFFFLQKLAMFNEPITAAGDGKEKTKGNLGNWVVRGIFDSDWMPDAKQSSREEAASIINRIAYMFNRWLRGYLSIIIIETVLYSILFVLFGVPHYMPLAFLAGATILLPYIGAIASFSITAIVCITFRESTPLLIALIGISLSYILINGILEQLLFYPTFVGEAIGLTTLETIIVVLIGALFGGITGMIFAVPAAAVLKYLIPKIYRIWIPKKDHRETSGSSP